MEAVGRLAGGVAHDFNNLMTAISGYSELLLKSLASEDPNRLDVEEIRKAGLRASGLTRQLLAFSRKQVLQARPLAVNDVLRELEKMLRRLIGEDIELALELAGDLATVKADPGQIEQVVMNLVINSRDAMPNGGRVTIATLNAAFGAQGAPAQSEIKSGRYVLLSVRDEGTGMDPATLSRIFEPFFTTKEQGKGTGLGLATVYGIVKQSGGHVFVESEVGQGTTFKIYLPAVGEAALPLAAAPAGEPRVGTETVLLVDDDEMVRRFAERVLREHGYTVHAAAGAEEALAACARIGPSIRLLLTDVVMPRVNGTELAARVRALFPGIRVVFMSGYSAEGVIDRALLSATTSFLQKPLTVEGLTRRVRDALDAPAPKP
jgi:CheY-like chemotaxis protein